MNKLIRTYFAVLSLLLASCQPSVDPTPQGVLAISFQTARTVVAPLEVDHYEVVLTNGTGATRSGSGEQTVIIDSLEDGTWALAAVALSATGSVVASGSTAVVLSGQGANVVVPLATTQDGYGTFSFTFTVPATVGIAAVQARLLHQGTSLGEVTLQGFGLPIDPDDPTRFKATLTNNEFGNPVLASGDYLLFLTFLGGNDQVLGHHAEAINVWDNVESNAWLDPEGHLHPQRDFAGSEFASTSAVPGGILVQGPGSLISFDPAIFEYSFHADGALSVTADEGVPGQDLQYRVEGGVWNPLRWGETLEVTYQTSTRIDLRVTAPDRSTFLDYALVDPYEVSNLPYEPSYVPVALTGDGAGNIFVVDASGGNIWRVSPTGSESIYIASNPSKGEYLLEDPVGIVRDDQGNLYISERNPGRVKKIDSDLNVEVLPNLDLVDPTGLALSQNGYLFIANGGSDEIVVYSLSDGSSTSRSVGATPQGLVVDDARGRLFVTCTDGTIRSFDLNENAPSTIFWSESGSNPYGLTIDPDGNLYACLFNAHRIVKIAPDGTWQTIVGDGVAGTLNGEGTHARVDRPYQIFRSPEGTFFFLDYNTWEVRIIQ